MSLPPATSDISDHPATNAVTDPVNATRLHEDLDRKLRLYVVLQAFRAGKMPDNTQIDEILQYMATHSPVDINALSPEGSELVKDIRSIIDTTREIVKQKNADELLQNFVWHTRGVDYSPAKKGAHEAAALSVDKAKEDSLQAAHHLRTLVSLLITNTEARKMLADFNVIGRDLLVRSANLLRPSEEALRSVDEPVSSTEPAFVNRDENVIQGEKKKLKGKAEGARQAAGEGASAIKGTRQDAEELRTEIKATDDSKVKREKAKEGMKGRLSDLKERVPSQYRERVNAQFDRARHFLGDEYFPKERRDRFIYRVKKIVVECQEDKSYQESIKWFLDALPQYGREGTRAATQDRGWRKQGEFQLAMDELKLLLTRFANGTSPQLAIDAFKRIMQLAKEDKDMSEWVGHVQDWIRKILLQPGYVLDAQSTADGKALREEGRKFYDEKYKSFFDNFFDAVSTWFTALTTDPLNTRFGEDWARLTRHLLFNAEGSLTWKPQLWADIRRVIIPQIIDKLGYIPIPRAEFSDQNLDLVIEDLTLSGRNLFPNIVSVEAHNYAKFSPYTAIHDQSNHTFVITLGQIQADLRDVMFYFKKKTGIAKLRDSGIADILLGGSGITSTIRLQSAPRDSGSLFFVRSVHVKVDALKFSIRDSQHDALYKFLRPIAVVIVKREVQRALTKSIKTAFETIDHLLVKARDRMDEAKLREGETRAGALKDFITKQKQEMREKKARQEGPGHFNISPKRSSLLLPNIGNPNSWFHRQKEEEKVVTEGREWRSKAFNVVPTATPASHAETPAGGNLARPPQTGGTMASAFGQTRKG